MATKVKIDNGNGVIFIDDHSRRNYSSLIFLCLLDVFVSTVNLIGYESNLFKQWNIVWMLIGIGALLYAGYIVLKKSSQSEIHFHEIDILKERQRLGKVVYSLKLKNGKSRDLPEFESIEEIEDLKTTLLKNPHWL